MNKLELSVNSLIKSPKSKNTYCAINKVSKKDISITLDGFGKLSFPMAPKKIQELKSYAILAKFGKGTKTLFNPKVRDVWEIPKKKLSIVFSQKLDKTIQDLGAQLGLEDEIIVPKLHNLLIYDLDQFFVEHKDSEKEDNMVGTLVIVLPQKHTGGELIVKQNKKQTKCAYRPQVPSEIQLVAFYADCIHEVTNVKSGHRVVLTYNLVVKKTRKLQQIPFSPGKNYQQFITQLEFCLKKSKEKRVFFLLDHQYSEKSLSWDLLKGSDRLRSVYWLQAAKDLGLELFLANCQAHQTWTAYDGDDGDYYGFYGGRSNRKSDGEYNLEELIEDYSEISHWIDIDNKKVAKAPLSIETSLIHALIPNSEIKPSNEEYEGYTGNAGNSLDRWYKRTVIVCWFKSNDWLFEIESSFERALAKAAKKPIEYKKIISNNMDFILNHFPSREISPKTIEDLFKISCVLNNELGESLLHKLSIDQLNVKSAPIYAQIIEKYSQQFMVDLLSKRTRYCFDSVKNIDQLCQLLPYKQIQANLINVNLNLGILSMDEIVQTLEAIKLHGDKKMLEIFIRKIEENEFKLDLSKLILLVKKINKIIPITNLKNYVKKKLSAELDRYQANKNNFTIILRDKCHCKDCHQLDLFLQSPTEKELIWPMGKPRRKHIHQVIDSSEFKITHKTKRTGSPEKLVITKSKSIPDFCAKKSKEYIKLLEELSNIT